MEHQGTPDGTPESAPVKGSSLKKPWRSIFQKREMPPIKSVIVVNRSYQQKAKQFLDHLLTLGHKHHGAKLKIRYIKEFFQFTEATGIQHLQTITAAHINEYYQYLVKRPNKNNGEALSLKTVNHHMRSIELFFIMLQSKGELEVNPTSTLKFPYPTSTEETRKVLSQEEIKELYNHCQSFQERAILGLAYGCGLRASELVSCNMEDIRLREGIIIVASGKLNKRRVVPMSSKVIKDLSDYFYQSRMHAETTEGKAFILHSKGKRMKKHTYNKILKRIIERTENKSIKAKQISIHNLRHSIATHLIEQKMPLEQVRMFLGHSQLETTEVYTHISQNQLQQLMRAR
ncbi:MAG TPA: tyrosine-type recombinase/integrase [Cytophagaceae bacterium]